MHRIRKHTLCRPTGRDKVYRRTRLIFSFYYERITRSLAKKIPPSTKRVLHAAKKYLCFHLPAPRFRERNWSGWRAAFARVELRMGDVINLRKLRKRAARQREEERASANRALHGRTKAERLLDESQAEKRRRDFDAHKIETRETS